MDQDQLERYTIEGLRQLAHQNKLDANGTRSALTDRIIDHFDRIGWPEPMRLMSSAIESQPVMTEEQSRATPTNVNMPNLNAPMEAADEGCLPNILERNPPPSSTGYVNILQDLVRAIIQTHEETRQARPILGMNTPQQASVASAAGSDTSTNTFQNWNQIKFTSRMIPPFSGREEENIVKWLERVANVARLYNVPDESLVLAAVNQLKDRALAWYNRQSVESVATWEEFKFQIRRYFERKESYTTILSRVSGRIWRAHAKRFVDYAEDKLQLMQFLTLTEKEKIELLADEVWEPSMRRLVLNTWVNTIPECTLEEARKIL